MNETLQGKKAVIFDLDGTLIYTLNEVLINNIRTALGRAGLPMRSRERLLEFYKKHNWDETLREWKLEKDEIEKFWDVYIDYVENREEDGTEVYEDVVPCLERLKKRNISLSVITSSTPRYLERQIKKIGNFFDKYFCVGNNPNKDLKQKPEPDGILYFAGKFKYSLSEVVSVGNSDLDTLTARNAGCLDILIDRGENSFSIPPTILIKSLDELI